MLGEGGADKLCQGLLPALPKNQLPRCEGKSKQPQAGAGDKGAIAGLSARFGRFIAVCAEAGVKEEGVPYPPRQGLLYSVMSPAGGSWQIATKNQLLFLFLLSADLT